MENKEKDQLNEYIISAFTENHTGVLNRITSVFLRRKINIENIKVSESPVKGISLFTTVAYPPRGTVQPLAKQMDRIVDVLRAEYYTAENLISQEVALFKTTKDIFRSDNIEQISRKHPLRVLEVNDDYVVLEKTGYKEDVDALRDELKNRGLLIQLSRSGSVILHRETLEETINGII